MYFVSRQKYYPEGTKVVEIAIGGSDYANPDMLIEKFPNEGKTYKDPRQAVEVAIAICKLWRKLEKDKSIKIAIGTTGGYTMPFETVSFQKALKWAEEEYQRLKKCKCGKIANQEMGYCSQICELGF